MCGGPGWTLWRSASRTARDCRRWARVISRGDERRDDVACGAGFGICVNGVSCRAEEQLETVKSILLE
jgi:hypothetical protein